MPHLTLQNSIGGPLIDLWIGASNARAEALTRVGKQAPAPLLIRGLIDTGASSTCIDPQILKTLELTPTGEVAIHTPSTGSAPHFAYQYDVSLTLVHPNHKLEIGTVPVIEATLSGQGIQALIGRDVLEQCLFIYDGQTGTFTLAF